MSSLVLPVAGEASPALRAVVSGGQPVVLVDEDGRPVAVVIDVDSWNEVEESLGFLG